jgi:hypothetical protein
MRDIQKIQLPLNIDHDYKLWFGKYNGKTLDQVALLNYPYLDWLYTTSTYINPKGKDTIRGLEVLLNSYVPNAVCSGENNCKNPATLISIAGDSRNGYSVGRGYIYCKVHKDNAFAYTPKAMIYPIEHQIIKNFDGPPGHGAKYDVQNIQGVLNSLAGFGGVISKNRAAEFFSKLKIDLLTRIAASEEANICADAQGFRQGTIF